MDILFLQTPAATLVEAPSWAKAIGGLVGPAGVAWLVLAEPVRHFHYLGLALILPGIYLVNKK